MTGPRTRRTLQESAYVPDVTHRNHNNLSAELESCPLPKNNLDPAGIFKKKELQANIGVFNWVTHDDTQRTRVLIIFGSTVENQMVPTMCARDVNFICMPRSTLAQMVGMVESLYQASFDKMETAGERVNITYPEVLVCVNLFSHLS